MAIVADLTTVLLSLGGHGAAHRAEFDALLAAARKPRS